jgi:hypothetical protein
LLEILTDFGYLKRFKNKAFKSSNFRAKSAKITHNLRKIIFYTHLKSPLLPFAKHLRRIFKTISQNPQFKSTI